MPSPRLFFCVQKLSVTSYTYAKPTVFCVCAEVECYLIHICQAQGCFLCEKLSVTSYTYAKPTVFCVQKLSVTSYTYAKPTVVFLCAEVECYLIHICQAHGCFFVCRS